jgi:cation transport ATPase
MAFPCFAQFRQVELKFQGTGCESCTQSLPSRLQRIRGVESAGVDAGQGKVRVKLAPQNRVRLEQLRDAVEQDGTRAVAATVVVHGKLERSDGGWVLQPVGVGSSYAVEAEPAELSAGAWRVRGTVVDLHPRTGPIRITDATVEKD